jgi:MFS family permease
MDKAQWQLLRGNIPKLYAFAFFQMFLVIIPVMVPFWQSKSLTLQQIFTLQGIFGASLIAFDAPSGYIADFFGRRKTLVVGSIISGVGFQILWFGQTFADFAVYEVILGMGLSLQSGCDVTILYNSLEKMRLRGQGTSYLGWRLTYQTVGEGIAALLGGFLAGIYLELPAYVNAVTAWVPVFIALSIYEPEGQRLPRVSHLQNLRAIGKAVFGHSKLLTFAISGFIFYGFATFVAVWSLQPYWQARGLDVKMFGYLWAMNNFLVAVMALYAGRFERKVGSVLVVCLIAVLPVIGFFGMGFTPGLWGLLFTLPFPICRALNQVIFQDAINTRVPAEMRATANSVSTLGMRALFIIFGPMVGHVLDTGGADSAMKTLGIVYLVGIFVVGVPLLSQRASFRS